MDFSKIAKRIATDSVRTAGRIEFVRDQGPIRRDIRTKDFKWKPETLRNLAKISWAAERGHSYAMAALRLFSKMPSSEFSPDGLLGGRGYIQQVKEMRSGLGQAVEFLSAFTDTIYDEINAPHWSSIDERDSEVSEIVEDAQEVKTHPEEYVESQFKQEVPATQEKFNEYENPSPEDLNPSPENEEPESNEEDQLSLYDNWDDWASPKVSSEIIADSSVPPETLPGPRVMHIGPGESPEEFGYFTEHNERPSDDLIGEGFSQFDRILEDSVVDGVTEYTNPTDGDESIFKSVASHITQNAGNYSWLPGASNEKLMNYYALGLTEEEVQWMRQNNQPDPPMGSVRSGPPKSLIDPLWPISGK